MHRTRAGFQSAAPDRMKAYADRKRRHVEYKPGQHILLSTANFTFKGPGAKKLFPKWIGPFPIKDNVGHVAVRLDLPPTYKMHNVFHVSQVKHAKGNTDTYTPPPALMLDGQAFWAVDTIVGHRERKAGRKTWREFLVRWEGYGPEHDTWEPESELKESTSVEQEIEKYLAALNTRRTRSKATLKGICCHMLEGATYPEAKVAWATCMHGNINTKRFRLP
jgi:Chromo (CHRromatin Organisation MOdifier) domain